MTYESFMGEVSWRSGVDSRQRIERAIQATLEIVGERMNARDAQQLADQLPAPLGEHLRKAPSHRAFGVEELFEHVKDQEPSRRLGIAVEHAKVVCQVLAEALDFDGQQLLRSRLPPEWADLFSPREPGHDREEWPRGPAPGHGHTLASGRPGSRRPLSEAAPPGGQREKAGSELSLSEARDPIERAAAKSGEP
jgi:uncharacterized protein (DUF2267 family)